MVYEQSCVLCRREITETEPRSCRLGFHRACFTSDQVSGDLARLRELHKADAAEVIQAIPEGRRTELAAALEASRLADLLEELPESEQALILNKLETADAIEVLQEMEIDDEIDLLKELDPTQREICLQKWIPKTFSKSVHCSNTTKIQQEA